MARPAGYRLNTWAFRDILAYRHLSRVETAAAAELTASYLNQLVAGSRSASIATTRRLAGVLGCAPETLFPDLIRVREEASA